MENWSILDNLETYISILSNERGKKVSYKLSPINEDTMCIIFIQDDSGEELNSQVFDIPPIIKQMASAIKSLGE